MIFCVVDQEPKAESAHRTGKIADMMCRLRKTRLLYSKYCVHILSLPVTLADLWSFTMTKNLMNWGG